MNGSGVFTSGGRDFERSTFSPLSEDSNLVGKDCFRMNHWFPLPAHVLTNYFIGEHVNSRDK